MLCPSLALGLALALPAAANPISRALTHLTQTDARAFDPATGNDGSMNCTPTAAAMCLDYWARNGYPGLIANANLNALYGEVKVFAQQGNCFKKGMSWRQMEEALKKWLHKHPTERPLKSTAQDADKSRDAVFNAFAPGGTAANDVIWMGFKVDASVREAQWLGHAMTLEWIDNKAEKPVPGEGNTGRAVGFADPATGAKHEFTMSKSGDLYENGKKVFKGGGFFTVGP
jgi:hypothetical protein